MGRLPLRHRLAPTALLAAALATILLAVLAPVPATAAPAGGGPGPGKVLVVTAPALRWDDLAEHDLPNIERWLGSAAVAMASMRTLGARTSIGEGYATMGAGNRASASATVAGLALRPQEAYEAGTAGEAFERRTGRPATGDLVQLGMPTIARANRRFLYGAEPGALARSLAEGGFDVGAVANGDTGLPAVPGAPLEPQPGEDPAIPGSDDVVDPEDDGEDLGSDEVLPGEDPAAEEQAPIEDPAADDLGVDEPTDGSLFDTGPPEEDAADEADDPAATEALTRGRYGRAIALAAMGPGGQVARAATAGLLRRDAGAPFGVRYDAPAVVRAFEAVWADVDVAFVELSDLDRADGYRRNATSSAAEEMWVGALRRSDELFGSLLEAVDPGTTVVLVTAAPPRARETLGVFAWSDGRGEGRLARSAATRRDGYVALTDLAPTILDHFGLDQPTEMTGTLITDGDRAAVDDDRFGDFATTAAVARFRDRATGPVSVSFVVVQIVAYALAGVAVARRRRWTRPVSFLALVVLATPPVVFLAGLLRIRSGSIPLFTLAVFAAAVVLAAAAEGAGSLAARRWPRTRGTFAPLVLVLSSWGLLVLDVLTGGRLQINTVFGYSPLVAGRFAGFGNLAFALVGVGAVVVACGTWATVRLARGPADGRVRLRGGAAVAVVAFLLATVVVDGAPMWGADVGGVLATVPGFAVLVLVAMGIRVGAPRLVAIGVGTALAVGAFAAVDLSRPEQDRTHLGRLVDRVSGEGGDGFLDVLQRKLSSNLNILTSSVWTLTIPFALGLLIYLARRRTGFLRDLQDDVPGIRPMLAGGLLVAVLGFALNDSGVAVPAMMFAVLLPYLTYVLLRWDPARP